MRGNDSQKTTRRGAQYAGSSALTVSRRLSSVGGTVASAGTTIAVTSSPHSGSGVPTMATSATPGWVCEDRLDRVGPDVLAARDDQLVPSTVHGEQSVVVDLAEIAGREPAVRRARIGAVAVAAQQHRSAQLHLAVDDPQIDTVERPPVVDDAAAGLGHAVGRHRVGRPVCGRPRAAEQDHAEQRAVDPLQGGRHQRDERRPAVLDGIDVELGNDREPGTGEQRSRHHRQATDVRQRQARQPVVIGGRRRAGPMSPRPMRRPRRG